MFTLGLLEESNLPNVHLPSQFPQYHAESMDISTARLPDTTMYPFHLDWGYNYSWQYHEPVSAAQPTEEI